MLYVGSALVAFSANRGFANSKFTNVSVSCSGEDSVGVRLCFAVKEKIRASHAFHLVEECNAKVLCISLITEDVDSGMADMEGHESAASVVMTAGSFFELAHFLYLVGANRIDSQSEDIVAQADKNLTDWKIRW